MSDRSKVFGAHHQLGAAPFYATLAAVPATLIYLDRPWLAFAAGLAAAPIAGIIAIAAEAAARLDDPPTETFPPPLH